MSRKLRALTEAQIRKAEAEGKLKGLEGEGKPLPHRPGDAVGVLVEVRLGPDPEPGLRPVGHRAGREGLLLLEGRVEELLEEDVFVAGENALDGFEWKKPKPFASSAGISPRKLTSLTIMTSRT